ncbi:MAG: hypothetical protein JST00_13530 [Deltaproteobacteria bacterium]|nr:hypothetical protein [Deltaproteobacteria bacterium]
MAGGAVIAAALVGCFPTGTAAGWDPPRDEPPPSPIAAGVYASVTDGSAEVLGQAELLDVAYVPSEAGPRVLVRGLDPRRKIENVRVQLLDARGAPALFDIEGDGVFEPDHIDVFAADLERSGSAFFFEIQSTSRVADYARGIRVEIDDGQVPPPRAMTAWLAPVPVRGAGEGCDPQGFDQCAGDLVCAGVTGEARCASAAAARAAVCASAPTLTPRAGETLSVDGRVSSGASLFEPTDGCTNGLRNGRPEATYRLFVDRPYREIVLSTQSPRTTFDTVLSLLDGCGETARDLACNDDAPPPYSAITMMNVMPGTYVVVVDSLARTGGAFELRVTAR